MRPLSTLNWLCWLQEADYDVWLILTEYLKPIIDMRITHKEIRYLDNPIFKKVAKRIGFGTDQQRRVATRVDRFNRGLAPAAWVADRDFQDQGQSPIYSVSYLRWYQGHLNVECTYQTKELFSIEGHFFNDSKLYGLTWYSTINDYKVNNIREVKDEVIAVMKLNEIDYKKSWTKQKLMKAILKHPIVEHSRVLDRFK